MKTVKETYFDDFKCAADKCRQTCCSGWQIVIDDDSLEKYDTYSGSLSKDFDENVDFEEGCFNQCENGDCSFLNSFGLCNLIIKGGEEMLCDTCRLYPRHCEEFEDVREWSLSVSCPEVAKMLCRQDRPIEFLVTQDALTDPLEDEFDDFDVFTYDKLVTARQVMFDIINDTKLNIYEKCGVLLEFSKRLQKNYDDGDVFLMEEECDKMRDRVYLQKLSKDFSINIKDFVVENIGYFDGLTRLSKDFEKNLKKLKNTEKISEADNELWISNLLTMYVYTYFCGSVYNGFIFANTYLCVFCVLFTKAYFDCCEKNGDAEVQEESPVRSIVTISRECEHADENVNALLERFDKLV